MALAKQENILYIRSGDNGSPFTNGNQSGDTTTYEIDTQNFTVNVETVFWGGNQFDEAVNGALRNNLRGFRPRITLNFQASLQPSVIRNLYNDIYTNFITDSLDDIRISFDDSSYKRYVPESMEYISEYTNTIGLFVPSMTFVARELETSIATDFQGA